jgi:DeoR/GlpR family transcriptional regulator of sugar metabolism
LFIEERHEKILEIIKEKKRVEVQELSKIFKVSEDSIRRDLRLMEQRGLINRTYGGAVLPNKKGVFPTFSERNNISVQIKEKIAKLASTFIEDNDTILLDGSTTISRIIPFLSIFNGLTVITNSIAIAYEINNSLHNVKLVILGGIVNQNIANTISIDTLKAIEKLNVDKAFIAPCFISEKWGLSCDSIEEAHIQRAMIEVSRKVFILLDSGKIGATSSLNNAPKSLVTISPIREDFTIITDSNIGFDIMGDFKEYINKGLKIIYE